MIPVKQTRLHSSNQKGNCYPAVIASILKMECEDVFQIQEHYDNPKWISLLDNWLLGKGWEIEESDDFKCFHPNLWYDRYIEIDNEISNPNNLTKYQWREKMKRDLKNKFYFVTGGSPRNSNINHIVIYQNGIMVHDPHPDNTGILTEELFSILVKII